MLALTRLLRAKQINIQVLSKPDCCLCDQAHFAISRILTNLGPRAGFAKLEKVNIESDPELLSEYSLTIPVIMVDGHVVAESIIDMPTIRKYLEEKISS